MAESMPTWKVISDHAISVAGKTTKPGATFKASKTAVRDAVARGLVEKVEGAKPVEDEQADPLGYGDMSKEQLIEELQARELPTTGNKPDLVKRLIEDDVGAKP